MAHPLDGAYRRVEWAEKRLEELRRIITLFTEQELERVHWDAVFRDGRIILNLPALSAPPPEVPILLGEVIYHLRSAMDYLVFELAKADSGRAQERTQFPIENTEAGFARRRKSFLNGVSQRHVDAIKRLQPCDGCDWTAALAELSNPDKHRELHAAFSIQEGEHSIFWSNRVSMLPPGPGKVYPVRDHPELHVKVQHESSMVVTFTDQTTPVVPILEILKAQVTETLDAFKPEFQVTES